MYSNISNTQPVVTRNLQKEITLFIKAKNGILKVLEIQGENAKKMSIGDFLRGNQIQEFDVFE